MKKNIGENDYMDYMQGTLKDEDLAREIQAQIDAAGRSYDPEAALSRVSSRIGKANTRRILLKIGGLAACMIIPLALMVGYRIGHDDPAEPEIIEVRGTQGLVSSIGLPDGSKVWLNSGSVLSYPTRFSTTREVKLEGEAFFSVARDEDRPFLVNVKGVQVEVLGTEFNVEAYGFSGRTIRTTLLSGSVRLNIEDGSRLKIHPGQCAEYDPSTGEVKLENVDAAAAMAWRDGRIVLSHTSLGDAFRLIENHYNVCFDVRGQMDDISFNGVFSNQSLDVVLQHFTISAGMKFTRNAGFRADDGREIITVNK